MAVSERLQKKLFADNFPGMYNDVYKEFIIVIYYFKLRVIVILDYLLEYLVGKVKLR